MRKIFLFMFLMFMSILNVSAQACDSADIKRLKEIANGVEITYELQEPIQQEYGVVNDFYKIKISGLTDELFIINETDEQSYYYNTDFNNNIILGGRKVMGIYSLTCSYRLKKVLVEMPVYNIYSDGNYCNEKENLNLDICKKWVSKEISEEKFMDAVHDDSQSIKKNNSNYYVIFATVMVLVSLVSFIIIYKRKKEVLV